MTTIDFILAATVLGFSLGFFTDHELWKAGETAQAQQQVKTAQSGETKLITGSQAISKDIRNAKDSCTGAAVPPAINSQLR